MTIGERIKEVRTNKGLTLEKFGNPIGLKKSSLSQIENGQVNVTDRVIKSICREFGVSDTWLRTGVGEPYEVRTREEEMGDLLGSLMKDSPESFRSRLITALLRFDPDGSEWQVLENIYNSVAAEAIERNTLDA